MSAAHAVAAKSAKDEAAASRNHKNAQAVPEMIPETQTGFPNEQFLVQRKENACACGGGCPRCLGNLGIQAKLKVGAPNDVYEQEADRVADQVMSMSEPRGQRQPEEKGEKEIQTKPLVGQITPLIQRQEVPEEEDEEEHLLQATANTQQTPSVTPGLHTRINALKGGGQPLSPSTRAFFEPRFGLDLSRVRVHTDAKAAEIARSINARAFTLQNNIVFGNGEYSLSSNSKKLLLAHELTHVVQQSNTQRSGVTGDQWTLFRAPKLRKKRNKRNRISYKQAEPVMRSIMGLINLQDRTNPNRWIGFKDEDWFKNYNDLIQLWFEVSDGVLRKRKDYALLMNLQNAYDLTEPIAKRLLRSKKKHWKSVLDKHYYAQVDRMKEAIREKIKENEINIDIDDVLPPTYIDNNPQPVSLELALQTMVNQPGESSVELSGDIMAGNKLLPGTTYKVSKRNLRVMLWTNGHHVLFENRGQIYVQYIKDFQEEIRLGTLIIAGQNAYGMMILTQIMTEIAMSFLPFGIVVDIAYATKAVAEGDWKGALLEIAPGGLGVALKGVGKVGKVVGKTRAGIKAVELAKIVTEIGAATIQYVGRGAFEIGSNIKQGFWIVTKKKAYKFYDEATGVLHDVKKVDADAFIKCSKCKIVWKHRDPSGPRPSETGLQYERRVFKETPLEKASKTYRGWRGGSRGSFLTWFKRLPMKIKKGFSGDAATATARAQETMGQSIGQFIKAKGSAQLKKLWGQREAIRKKLLKRIEELRKEQLALSSKSGPEYKHLQRQIDQLVDDVDEITDFDVGTVGSRRPDQIELFPKEQRAVITDVTLRPYDPLHNLKTTFYSEVVREITGWTDVVPIEYKTALKQVFPGL